MRDTRAEWWFDTQTLPNPTTGVNGPSAIGIVATTFSPSVAAKTDVGEGEEGFGVAELVRDGVTLVAARGETDCPPFTDPDEQPTRAINDRRVRSGSLRWSSTELSCGRGDDTPVPDAKRLRGNGTEFA